MTRIFDTRIFKKKTCFQKFGRFEGNWTVKKKVCHEKKYGNPIIIQFYCEN